MFELKLTFTWYICVPSLLVLYLKIERYLHNTKCSIYSVCVSEPHLGEVSGITEASYLFRIAYIFICVTEIMSFSLNLNKQCLHIATLKRVRVTITAVEKE